MGNIQDINGQNQLPLNININSQNNNTNLINNQQLNQEEVNIDIINKDKVIVKIPTSNNIIWQKEYFKNDLIGTVINDYILENNIKNTDEFLNNLIFEERELNLQDEINSLLNTHNKTLNISDISEKDKYIELIAKPFSDPFEIYCFSKNNKNFKIIRYTNELKENKKIKNFSSSSAYCNGSNHLYISGGEKSRNLFWEINLKTNIINDPIQIPPKQNHSMIYIPKNIVFIVGGNDLNTFYYHIQEKRILNWGKLNNKRIEPALQVIQNKLYCFDSLNSFYDKNNYTIEITDINANEGKWSIIRPILPLKMVFSQQLFGVSKDKDNNIIFLGGSLNKSENDMNFMYTINNNSIDCSNVKYLNFNLKEKTFIQINRTYECILPDFDRTSPQIVFYNKNKGKIELINFAQNINNSKIFEVILPLKIIDNNNSVKSFDDSSSSYVTFKNKNLKDNSNNLYNIDGSGINKNKNRDSRVNGVSPNVSFWKNDKNNMSNASKNISLLNNSGKYNKKIILSNSSLFGNKENIISTISPNSSFIKNIRSSNSPSFSFSKSKIVKGVSPNLSFCEGDSKNNNKYEINLERNRFSKMPIINNNKTIDNTDINRTKRKKNNNEIVYGVSPNLSFWEGDPNNLNNKYERASKMPILKNNTIIDNNDINSIKSKNNNNNNGKVFGVSPNLSFWEGDQNNLNNKFKRAFKTSIINNNTIIDNNDINSVKSKNNNNNNGKVCGASPNLSFWEGDQNNNNNKYKINLKRSKISINHNSTIDNSDINSVKKGKNINGKVYGVSPNLSFWESDSNINNNKNDINLKRSKYSQMSINNDNKNIDSNDINSVKRNNNNNKGNVSGVSPNLSFWEYNSSNDSNKYQINLKRNETSKIPIINNNKNIYNSQINSINMKKNNKSNVLGVSPNLSFWEGDSSNNNNLDENNLKRNKTSKILIINNKESIYNSQINNEKRKNNNKSNACGVSPNLSFWDNSSQNLNINEINSSKRSPNQISIKNNIEDNNNNDIIFNSQKINKIYGVSPNLSFWSNSPKNLNINEIIPLNKKTNLSIKNNIEDNYNSNNNNNNSLIIKGKNINKINGVSPNLSFWESNENKNINIGNDNDNDKPIWNKNDFNENNKVNNNIQIKNKVQIKSNKNKSSYMNGVFPKIGFWADDKDKNLNKTFNNINERETNANQIYGNTNKNDNDKKINTLRKPNKNNESFVIIRNHIFN